MRLAPRDFFRDVAVLNPKGTIGLRNDEEFAADMPGKR